MAFGLHGLLLLWSIGGCADPPAPPGVPVAQALDVPPPPGQTSLDVGPTDTPCEPGAWIDIEGVKTSIVDCREGLITVYADEAPAREWLASGRVSLASPWLSAVFQNQRRLKPPLSTFTFDVELRNPSSESRWLILPETFPYKGRSDPAVGKGDECELQPYLLSKEPRVLWVRGICTNFQAVRLPGDALLKVRGVKIEAWWEDTPPAVDLELRAAKGLKIGGVELAELLGVDVESSGGAEVDGYTDAGDPRVLSMWHPTPESNRAVAVDVDQTTRARVPLVK